MQIANFHEFDSLPSMGKSCSKNNLEELEKWGQTPLLRWGCPSFQPLSVVRSAPALAADVILLHALRACSHPDPWEQEDPIRVTQTRAKRRCQTRNRTFWVLQGLCSPPGQAELHEGPNVPDSAPKNSPQGN